MGKLTSKADETSFYDLVSFKFLTEVPVVYNTNAGITYNHMPLSEISLRTRFVRLTHFAILFSLLFVLSITAKQKTPMWQKLDNFLEKYSVLYYKRVSYFFLCNGTTWYML